MPESRKPALSAPLEVFFAFLALGLTSFGGPVAHIAYFRAQFVEKRRWLGEHAYADLVALCQFLPGPSSSQVGMAIGLARGGVAGALAAWLGFTLPSAALLVLFALFLRGQGLDSDAGWLHGLKLAAVAVVGQALWQMARTLAAGKERASMAAAGALCALAFPGSPGQILVILGCGLAGWLLLPDPGPRPDLDLPVPVSKPAAAAALALLFGLLLALPLAWPWMGYAGRLFTAFFRAGSLVFGGGHVVLPLLRGIVVPPGWVGPSEFLAGYGAAQAMPGPLFAFAGYLGAVSSRTPNGWIGAGIALAAVFLPSLLLVVGVLPFWSRLRGMRGAGKAILGVNAGVVGLLLAALYDPVFVGSVHGGRDFAVAAAAFVLLESWKAPPLLVVALAALAAALPPAGWV